MISRIDEEKEIAELIAAGDLIGGQPKCVKPDWAKRIVRARIARKLGFELRKLVKSNELESKYDR
jgi:hypothetical protein